MSPTDGMKKTSSPRPKSNKKRKYYVAGQKTRYRKEFAPDIADDAERDQKDLYYGTLVERLIVKVRARMAYDATRYQPEHRCSMANIARATGIKYRSMVHYLTERNTPMTVQTLDKILWATKMSILDLIEPSEILSHIKSMTSEERLAIRSSFYSLLDRLERSEYDNGEVGAADSQ